MQDQDQSKTFRVRLGPIASTLVDGASEPPAVALDQRIEALQEDARRVPDLEVRLRDQMALLGRLAAAGDYQTKVNTTLINLVDSRTRELSSMILHISGLVGKKFADEISSQQVHQRLTEIAEDFAKDAKQLSGFLVEAQRELARGSSTLTKTIDEQQLTVPMDAERERASSQKERSNGFER